MGAEVCGYGTDGTFQWEERYVDMGDRSPLMGAARRPEIWQKVPVYGGALKAPEVPAYGRTRRYPAMGSVLG